MGRQPASFPNFKERPGLGLPESPPSVLREEPSYLKKGEEDPEQVQSSGEEECGGGHRVGQQAAG